MNSLHRCFTIVAASCAAILISSALFAGTPEASPSPVASGSDEALPVLPQANTSVPGVEFYRIKIEGTGPGRPMELDLYLPAGRHDAKSLPCVFIAPAGTGQHGAVFEDGDRVEHFPYVKAGFAVMAYDLSGPLADPHKDSYTYGDMMGPVARFMEADGGLINGRTAIDYVLKRVPEVDPAQLYACGHSSAATVALNLARGDARIKACCAYAPQVDVEKWWSNAPKMDKFVPGYKDFPAKKSPLRHVADFNCPVYLFHADDDSQIPMADMQAFVAAMQAAGKKITFDRVATGDHYQSMIDHGIAGGIKFMESVGAKPLPPVVKDTASH
ncbi:MAG TPA: prolyl oligopeptidase family serine peptidase [Chthoniobacteraceae bacterium]|nr:prolyl oligopeptidase family serine peptidase [Chthoniobacteraceae bacterium]